MKRVFCLIAIAAFAVGPIYGADIATKAGAVTLSNQLSKTCSNMVRGNIFREPDGGYHESPQGWFSRAEVHQRTTWALAYCYYGLDMAAPANRPVYSVHYQLTGFTSNQCSVSGATIACTKLPVLKP